MRNVVALKPGIRYKTYAAIGLLAATGGLSVGLGNLHGMEQQADPAAVYEAVDGSGLSRGSDSGEMEKGKIAITFDDGPHPYYTEQLLDGLKKRGVTATFFVTGEHASLHPELILRMQEEGHLIGNHTYSHLQLRQNNQEEFRQQLIKTNEIIEGITGETVEYVRPPYGTWDRNLEEELDMIPVLWTIDPLDWCSDNVECIKDHVVSQAGENEIILMHDYYPATVTAALEIVDILKAQGYEFVTVEEILLE